MSYPLSIVSELQASGIDRIVEEAKTQIDAWKGNQ